VYGFEWGGGEVIGRWGVGCWLGGLGILRLGCSVGLWGRKSSGGDVCVGGSTYGGIGVSGGDVCVGGREGVGYAGVLMDAICPSIII
jgi:hypothetical protein